MKNIKDPEMSKEDYRKAIAGMIDKINSKSGLRRLFLFAQVYYLAEVSEAEEV